MAQLASFNQVIDDIVQDNQKEFGMKYKPRKAEPSMFALLSWQPPESSKNDYKSDKVLLDEQGYSKFKTKIAKTNDPYTSETNDNYRRYHYDKQTGGMIPEYDEETLHQLAKQKEQKSPQKQPTYLYEDTTRNVPEFIQSQVEHQIKNQKNSIYKNEHSYKNIETQQQLAEELAKNKKKSKSNKNFARPQSQGGYYVDQEEEEQVQQLQQQQNKDIDEQQYQSDDEQQQRSNTVKNQKKKSIGTKKSAKVLDPEYEKDRLKRRQQRIKQMESTTRWLPNSAFQTYFGKPAFENYGMGNVKPPNGGMIYGNYLLSHNVNPHKGEKEPKYQQSFKNALDYGDRLPDTQPEPPRKCKDEFKESQKQIEEQKARNPLSPTKNNRGNLKIVKPDLINSLRFASEENSPVDVTKSGKAKKTKKQVQFGGDETYEQQQFQNQQQQQFQEQTYSQDQQQYITSNQGSGYVQQQQYQSSEMPDRPFIQELKRKKAKQNRISLKVTEVVPVVEKSQVVNTRNQNRQEAEKENRGQAQIAQEEQLYNLEDHEIDPRSYKNIAPKWMQRIPYAGKKYEKEKPFSAFE